MRGQLGQGKVEIGYFSVATFRNLLDATLSANCLINSAHLNFTTSPNAPVALATNKFNILLLRVYYLVMGRSNVLHFPLPSLSLT
jgi:NADH:ubiquinone oxidoreductase subunit K